jgi:Na+/proline symporter
MLIGYLPLAFLVGSLDLGVARVIVPIISGISLGLAQWRVLRPYISKSYGWILNHAVGWVVGLTLGLFFVQLLSKTPLGMLVGFMSFGLIVALFQYPVLRREIPHLATWILANVIGWTLGAYLGQGQNPPYSSAPTLIPATASSRSRQISKTWISALRDAPMGSLREP